MLTWQAWKDGDASLPCLSCFWHLPSAWPIHRLTAAVCRGVGATVCCPGPLATGLDGKPRVVYGPGGLITQVRTGVEQEAWEGAEGGWPGTLLTLTD